MGFEYGFGLFAATLIAVYLVYALLLPEKF